MVNSERLSTVNLGDGVKYVNLSTNVENSAANQVRRVLCPVSFRFAQGPRQPLRTLCICTSELCIHPVHQFTKLCTLSLTQSRGFPTPCPNETLRGPGICWDLRLAFAGGINASGERGIRVPLKAVLLMLLV